MGELTHRVVPESWEMEMEPGITPGGWELVHGSSWDLCSPHLFLSWGAQTPQGLQGCPEWATGKPWALPLQPLLQMLLQPPGSGNTGPFGLENSLWPSKCSPSTARDPPLVPRCHIHSAKSLQWCGSILRSFFTAQAFPSISGVTARQEGEIPNPLHSAVQAGPPPPQTPLGTQSFEMCTGVLREPAAVTRIPASHSFPSQLNPHKLLIIFWMGFMWHSLCSANLIFWTRSCKGKQWSDLNSLPAFLHGLEKQLTFLKYDFYQGFEFHPRKMQGIF